MTRMTTTNSKLHRRLRFRKAFLGASIDSVSPFMAEMAGKMGYDVVWADQEHGGATSREIDLFCLGARAGGAFPLIRIQELERTHVLRALDAGARLVVAPMIETPEHARFMVECGKFPPLGKRGFSGNTPGRFYGIGDKLKTMRWSDRETHLFPMIETPRGVERIKEIMAVDGITGGVVGPSDLSIALGKPLMFDDREVLDFFSRAIRGIRAVGKIAACIAGHPALLKAAFMSNCQIIICAGECSGVRFEFQQTLKNISLKIHRLEVKHG